MRAYVTKGLMHERTGSEMIRVVTSFGTLMRLAKAVAEAKRGGDRDKIAEAVKAHEDYKQMCLKADEMLIGVSIP